MQYFSKPISVSMDHSIFLTESPLLSMNVSTVFVQSVGSSRCFFRKVCTNVSRLCIRELFGVKTIALGSSLKSFSEDFWQSIARENRLFKQLLITMAEIPWIILWISYRQWKKVNKATFRGFKGFMKIYWSLS